MLLGSDGASVPLEPFPRQACSMRPQTGTRWQSRTLPLRGPKQAQGRAGICAARIQGTVSLSDATQAGLWGDKTGIASLQQNLLYQQV